MAILAVAITLSFHLKSRPSDVELRMALPLGLVFWVLAVACLAMGLGNYISACVYYLTRSILTHYLSIRASLLVTAAVFFMRLSGFTFPPSSSSCLSGTVLWLG